MTNVVEISPEFKRDIKPLAKKYHTLKKSIEDLQKAIIENPYLGVSYGSNMYKVRLADESKGSGKSGGFRVLYYHLEKTKEGITILLTNIYDKSEIGTIKKADAVKQLEDIIKEHERKKMERH
jgi:mRNA-degrading endonuclease RelE of RelBE toxin-antitoxin system